MPATRLPKALAPILVLASLGPLTRLALRHGVCDDGYIVLAVLRNAFAGRGVALDPGSGDAVLSTLLWPVFVALPMAAGVPGEVALALLGVCAQAALGACAFFAARAVSGSEIAAAGVAALLATHPVVLLPALGGMETALYLALLSTTVWALAAGRFGVAALAAGLLPWVRFDGALATLVFLIAARRAGGTRAAKASVWGAVLGLGAFVAHRLLFERWLPDSLTAKLDTGGSDWAGGALEVATEFVRAAAGMSAYWLVTPSVHIVLVPLAVAGAVRVARRRLDPAATRALVTVAIWAAGYTAFFVLSGRGYARNFPWYFAPPLLALATFAAAGAAPLADRLVGTSAPAARFGSAALAVLVVLAAAPSLLPAFERVGASFTSHRERAYAAAAIWLGAAGPAESVASNEIGALAWHSPPGVRIVDLFGISRPLGEPRRDALEVVRTREPRAIVTRLDFGYRGAIETGLPGAYVWVRFGSLDLGLEPELARRLEPRASELERIYRALTVESGGRLGAP